MILAYDLVLVVSDSFDKKRDKYDPMVRNLLRKGLSASHIPYMQCLIGFLHNLRLIFDGNQYICVSLHLNYRLMVKICL